MMKYARVRIRLIQDMSMSGSDSIMEIICAASQNIMNNV